MMNPKVLNLATQAARALAWQRLIPLALLVFLVAQRAQRTGQDARDETI